MSVNVKCAQLRSVLCTAVHSGSAPRMKGYNSTHAVSMGMPATMMCEELSISSKPCTSGYCLNL